MRINLTAFLMALLPVALASCSSESTSQKGQMITCETDPGTDVILRCEPGEGEVGDTDSCTDVDEDGDGEPTDTPNPTILSGDAPDDDDDGDQDDDGVDDEDDCDEHPGEDDDDDNGEVDLPYNFNMSLGETYAPIIDAFAEKGAQPAQIVSISGATWRAAELAAGTSFVITQADCDHAGNKDVGRDRLVITWKNADGSTDTDHMTLRYCN